MTVPIVVTVEDQVRALGLVMANLEDPDAAGELPAEYVAHLVDVLEERGPIPVTHGLVALATTFVRSLAHAWDVPPEEVIRRTAVALAKELPS